MSIRSISQKVHREFRWLFRGPQLSATGVNKTRRLILGASVAIPTTVMLANLGCGIPQWEIDIEQSRVKLAREYPFLESTSTLSRIFQVGSALKVDILSVFEKIINEYDPELPAIALEGKINEIVRNSIPNVDDLEQGKNLWAFMIYKYDKDHPTSNQDIAIFPIAEMLQMAHFIYLGRNGLLMKRIAEYSDAEITVLRNCFFPKTEIYNFFHIAKSILIDNPDLKLKENARENVAKIVEYVANRFMHVYEIKEEGEYYQLDMYATNEFQRSIGIDCSREGEIKSKKLMGVLSEMWQREIGGCGMASFMVISLCHALGIPAELVRPDSDSHRSVNFPSLNAWVHGDSVVAGFGIRGEDVIKWGEKPKGTPLLDRDPLQIKMRSRDRLNGLFEDLGGLHPSKKRSRAWRENRIGLVLEERAEEVFGNPQFQSFIKYYNWLGLYVHGKYIRPSDNKTCLEIYNKDTKFEPFPNPVISRFEFGNKKLFDEGMYGNNLMPKGSGYLTYVKEGMNNNGLHLDGQMYLEADLNASLQRIDDQFSFVSYIKPRKISKKVVFMAIGDENAGCSISYDPDGNIWGFKIQGIDKDGKIISKNITKKWKNLSLDGWRSLAITYENGGEAAIWLDGEKILSETIPFNAPKMYPMKQGNLKLFQGSNGTVSSGLELRLDILDEESIKDLAKKTPN
ncbi:MAG: hypothetical protein FD145_1244 [Candidatus Saganbacteria bacterium]|uniref:Transglutaminase-like domain-containing protein n=1 Tax=Candidatus Saganbacteria bacterium TaxID=2575572 RepID=A0A833L0C3_UNCSA|nr:MAG: hypothetical protein FD145_1244 [Candidatus Saganbacteria bacterium]